MLEKIAIHRDEAGFVVMNSSFLHVHKYQSNDERLGAASRTLDTIGGIRQLSRTGMSGKE
jgi:hypothetical protein